MSSRETKWLMPYMQRFPNPAISALAKLNSFDALYLGGLPSQ
jgi:hypothetical protein